jgi:hypothetical protein
VEDGGLAIRIRANRSGCSAGKASVLEELQRLAVVGLGKPPDPLSDESSATALVVETQITALLGVRHASADEPQGH